MKNAIFTITEPNTKEVVQKYELEWKTLHGLQVDFLESRQVWSECLVTVDTDTFQLSTPHTWREEVLGLC
jgi:hypothetical protein